MAEDLGTAKGKIEIDASQAERALGDFDKKASQSAGGLTALSGALAGIGAVGVGAFALTVKSAADFEKQLSGIKAVSSATEKQMDSLRKKALQLGADTAFSASDAALAMEELVKAGLSVDEVLNGAADAAVYLAAAGEIDLPQAATIAANAMNQFGLSAEQMPHVADLIAGAANASAIDVSEFGLSLAQAGATANLAGLSFDDLSVAIAAMGNAGIKGSDAGTSLKTFLSNLQPTTEKQIDLFYDLGLAVEANGTAMNEMGNAFFTGEGQIKSMSEIAGILQNSLAGMSEQQKLATLEALFGSDAIRAAAIIADNGSEGFDSLAASMGEVGAQEVAETRMDNLAGSIEQFKGSLETLLITVGTPFLDFLREIVDRGTGVLNWLGETDQQMQTLVVGTAAGASGLALLAGSAGLFVRAAAPAVQGIGTLASGVGSLASTLVSTLGPWGLLVLAVIALVAAAVYAYQHFEGFRKIVDTVADRIVEFGKKVYQWINDVAIPAIRAFGDYFLTEVYPKIRAFVDRAIEVIQNVVRWITGTAVPKIIEAWDFIVEKAVAAWNWFNENVVSTVAAAVKLVIAVVQRIVDFITVVAIPYILTAWNTIWPIVQFVFDTIMAIVQNAMNLVMNVVGFVLDAVLLLWNTFGDNVIQAVTIAFEIVRTIIETVLGIIRGIFQVITGLITGDWDKFLQGIRTIWDSVWGYITGAVSIVMDTLKLAIETALEFIKTVWNLGWDAVRITIQTVWDTIKFIVETAINAVKTTIETVINAIKGIVETTLNTIQFIWETVWSSISSFVSGIWDDIKGFVKGGLDSIWSAIQSAGQTLMALWDGLWETIKSALSNAWDAIVNTVEDKIGDIVDFFTDLPGNIVDAITGLADKLVEIGKAIIQWVIDGIKAAPGAIKDAIMDLVPSAGDIIGGIGGAIKGGISDLNPFAVGGIVTRPTAALIGEAGKEAVIPMENHRRALELLDESGLKDLVLSTYVQEVNNSAAPSIASATSSSPSGSSAAPGIVTGMHVEELNVYDAADWQMIQQQQEFAMQGQMA